MMRLIITFILSLCIILPKGYASKHAHGSHKHVCHTLVNVAGISKREQYQGTRTAATIDKASSPITPSDLIDEKEVEDEDETSSSKKLVNISNHFFAVYYALAADDIARHSKKRLPACEHFSFSSSSKYIVQRAIRI